MTRPFPLCMMESDHFKGFSDTRGNQEGGAVLRDLARLLHPQIRRCDLPARSGGGECSISMPQRAGVLCVKVAEGLASSVEKDSTGGSERSPGVTVSTGVAAVPRPDVAGPAGPISDADRALSHAGKHGRDRVEC